MKVCVGLSGGVDSSVAALLLKEQGHEVFALFMQNWHDVTGTLHGDCEWEEDRFVAQMVAKKIGIPFHFVDLSETYRKKVVDYMFSEYEKGRTPNPDVLCNREIKFDAFLQEALRLGADMVATGHYCRKQESVGEDGSATYHILAGTDPGKDQSYFLCQLNQQQLSKALFPIGHLLKKEVREIARNADLPSAEKKDSQGICFVGKVDLPVFLQQKIQPHIGNVVEVYGEFFNSNSLYAFHAQCSERINAAANIPSALEIFSDEDLEDYSKSLSYRSITFETETYRSGKKHVKKTRFKANTYGKIVGEHEGAQFYTIGQRHGLAVGGHSEPVFVIGTDTDTNTVYVGQGHTHPGLQRRCLRIVPDEIHWIRPDMQMGIGQIRRYRVRIRYRQPLQWAYLMMRSNGLFIVFEEFQRGITPGQFAVWYDDNDEMLGSGVI